MFWIILWIYTFFVLVVWALFILVRIHALKFNSFQTKISINLKILCVLLIILTFLWYVFVFSVSSNNSFLNLFNSNWKDNLFEDMNLDKRTYY